VYGSQELLLYALPLLAFDWLYPRRVLPAEPPTAGGMAGEVLCCLVLYDALFTVSHRWGCTSHCCFTTNRFQLTQLIA
jgi:hypothetical protein